MIATRYENYKERRFMKLFIKADNYTIKFALIMTVIADIALVIFGIIENTMKISFVLACGLTILVALLSFSK